MCKFTALIQITSTCKLIDLGIKPEEKKKKDYSDKKSQTMSFRDLHGTSARLTTRRAFLPAFTGLKYGGGFH